MQIYDIKVDADGRGLNQHGSDDYPCAFYDEKFSAFIGGEVPWHWHELIEIVLVVEDSKKVECVGQSDILNVGDIVLINSGALHRFTDVGSVDCRILNFIFEPQLIGGSQFSRLYQKYVRPVIINSQLSFYKFSKELAWHRQVSKELQLAMTVWQNNQPGYELTTSAVLMNIWQLLCSHEPQLLSSSPQSRCRYWQ